MKKLHRSLLLPIFITVFLDMLGVTLLIPVLPALFFQDTGHFFSPEVSAATRSILFGLLLAIYPFMQFFGAPLLGSLSDRYGRKPILMLSLTGTLVGYLLFAASVHWGGLALLFASRALPGFMGGNISIAYSAIADISDAASRPKNFGIVGMAFGLGFVLGPFFGGVLSDDTVLSWFDASTPFWFSAVLTLLNILLMHFNFRETLRTPRPTPVSALTGFRNLGTSFTDPRLRVIFAVVLLFSLGFTFFAQFFAAFLYQKFDYTEKDAGLLFAWVGVWIALTAGLLVRRLNKISTPSRLLVWSLPALALFLALVLVPEQAWVFYFTNPFIAIFQGVAAPNLTALVSTQAGPERQGEILGINQSMQSVGQMLPAVAAGYLNTLDVRLPMVASAGLVLLAWAVLVGVFLRGNNR